jgi:hypothetical protein
MATAATGTMDMHITKAMEITMGTGMAMGTTMVTVIMVIGMGMGTTMVAAGGMIAGMAGAARAGCGDHR